MDTSDDYGTINVNITDNKKSIEIEIIGNNFNSTQHSLLSKITEEDFAPLRSRNTKYSLKNKNKYDEIRNFIHSLPEDGIIITDEAYRLEQGRTSRATRAAAVSELTNEFSDILGFGDVRTVEQKARDIKLVEDMLTNPLSMRSDQVGLPSSFYSKPVGVDKYGNTVYKAGKRTKRRRGKKSRKGKSKKRYSRRR